MIIVSTSCDYEQIRTVQDRDFCFFIKAFSESYYSHVLVLTLTTDSPFHYSDCRHIICHKLTMLSCLTSSSSIIEREVISKATHYKYGWTQPSSHPSSERCVSSQTSEENSVEFSEVKHQDPSPIKPLMIYPI